MNIVYKITNLKNGRVYIGSSRKGIQRFVNHKSKLRIGNHINKYLQADFNLFGEEAFEYSIILIVEDSEISNIRKIEEREISRYEETVGTYNILTNCGAIYPNIIDAGITHKFIADAFGYKNVKAFNRSTAHKRHMQGIENLLKHLKDETKAKEYVSDVMNWAEKGNERVEKNFIEKTVNELLGDVDVRECNIRINDTIKYIDKARQKKF